MRTDRRPQRDRRGNYALLTGILMTVIVGFSALSIDISLITLAQIQAQAAADAASHAALIGFRQDLSTAEGDAAAEWIVGKNQVAMGTATIDAGYPRYGQWNYTTKVFTPGLVRGNANAAEVRLSREGDNAVDLLLAPLLGINEHEVHAESITSTQLRAIMLVVDMSCSMMGDDPLFGWNAVDYNRMGALTFLDYFRDHPQDGDLLGMAMFAEFANLKPTNVHPWGMKVSVDTPNPNQRPWAPLTEVQEGEPTLRTRFKGICNTKQPETADPRYPSDWECKVGGPVYYPLSPTGTVVSHPRADTNGTNNSGTGTGIGKNTNPEPAIRQATNELVTRTDTRYFRGILFMSDGVPNVPDETTAKADAQDAADDAWDHDISIWSLLYHNGEFDDAFMQSMVRGSGYFLTSPDAADLPAMYEQVAKSIPTALVY